MANPNPNRSGLRPPWPKGVSANPGGRKRKVITDSLIGLLDSNKVGGLVLPEGRTLQDVILESIVRNLIDGNAKTIADLWDRLEGKVAQEVGASADNPLVQAIQGFMERTANQRGSGGGKKGGTRRKKAT